MYALGTRSYAFPVHSRAFAAYALLKASLFFVLPRVDRALAAAAAAADAHASCA